ncbi:MAG: hypothetical protein JXA00_03000, partial [Candidatus Thermoplasmatota archaeon]|nr:hypothetical protein [Candidatus Thermoplasmatota archaeon]
GRRTSDVEQESITVTYDYRTGRWSGDDSLMDTDGYGHYLGETFEIWFNLYQIDYDNDFIPYWTEVNVLRTDPTVDDSTLDPDNDGIPTTWEWKWGYDPFTWDDHNNLDPDLDGLDNCEEYQMAKYFSNPFYENIYYEVDYMGSGGLNDPPHIFFEESQQGIIERFAENNIQLIFDYGWPDGPSNGGGQELPHINKISQDSGMMLQFYEHYFSNERKGIFRYLVIGHGGGFQHPSKNNIFDSTQVSYVSSKLPRPLKIITDFQSSNIYNFIVMGVVPTQRGKRVWLGSLILHEMAHSCSVGADSCRFEGIDNISYGLFILPNKEYKNTWGQYHSVLNYLYCNYPTTFDLSHGDNGPPYDQDDWSMMFVGFFQYNTELVEEPYYEPTAGESLVTSEQPGPTGYVYDPTLTNKYIQQIGSYSPNPRFGVNWSVYRLVDKEQYPDYKDVKVFAQPDIKTTQQWVLNREADLDDNGEFVFYSFDEIMEERTK